jgi:hypothetical protein
LQRRQERGLGRAQLFVCEVPLSKLKGCGGCSDLRQFLDGLGAVPSGVIDARFKCQEFDAIKVGDKVKGGLRE